MKKIGILTFQFADNYGAVLQSYALRKTINAIPGCEAQIINYIPPMFQYAKTWESDYERAMYGKKRASFERFLEVECGIKSPKNYTLKDIEKCDYYCAGSDQIWNTNKINEGYFLADIAACAKRISYAASIGYSLDNPKLRLSVLERYLPQFDTISVREQVHVPLVEKMTGKTCECVLDPTLLLDASAYEAVICPNDLKDNRFIFFFWLKGDSRLMRGVEFVNNLSRKTGLPIVHSINSAPDFLFVNDGGNMQFEGIENFLWYVKNAEYVITNSYHATIFSILFQKSFYTFVVKSMKSRTDTLSDKLGCIAGRMIEEYLPLSEVDKEIDYDEIYKRINEEKKRSLKYLYRALEIEEEL